MDKQQVKKITEYIFLKTQPQSADLAIVFGTRFKEPIEKTAELYKKKLVPKILVSGGINKKTGEIEAREIAKALIKMGVKQIDIITEDKSTNSLENVLFSRDKIEQTIGFKNIKKIIAVVKHYHSRRALMTLKKHFPKNIELIPVTYEIYDFTKDNWFASEPGIKKVMGEYKKIQKYLQKGDIEEL